MAAPLTRRGVLGGFAAAGALLAVGAPAACWPTFERRAGRVLIVDEGAFTSEPARIAATLAAQGFRVHTIDFAEEGIDLGTVQEFDAVIVGPRLSRQDRAWLQLALRTAQIRTPVIVAETSMV